MRTVLFLAAAALVACNGANDKAATDTGLIPTDNPTGGTAAGTAGGTPTGSAGGTPTGAPTGLCGNGVVDPGEDCDGTDLNSETCSSIGYHGAGNLGCTPQCTWDVSGCTGPFSNHPQCQNYGQIAPAYGEEGHWIASRIQPPVYPFTVDEITYTSLYFPGQGCSPEFEHFVQIWADGPAPISDPILHDELTVPMGTSSTVNRQFVHNLSNPITLQQDEYLYVSIQLMGWYPYVSCLQTCEDNDSLPEYTWWSHAIMSPFSWTNLDIWGINASLDVRVDGSP